MRVSEQEAKKVTTDDAQITVRLIGHKAINGDCYAIIDQVVRPYTAMTLAAMEYIKATIPDTDTDLSEIEAVIKDLFQGASANSVQRRWVIFDMNNRPIFQVLDPVGDPYSLTDQFITARPVREDDEGAVMVTTVRLWHDT